MRESRWPPSFMRALKRNLQGSFFCCCLIIDRCLCCVVSGCLWANEANKSNGPYMANEPNSVRLIGLMGLIA